MSKPDLSILPGIVLDKDEPVFSEPWEAHAFAMTLALYNKGMFAWSEWADYLSAEIHGPTHRDYYQHWLIALEKLMAARQAISAEELSSREAQWHEAAARTPHGQPIELQK